MCLRQTGHSIPEIKKLTGRSAGSVFKYVQGANILPEYKEILRIKQGGSKELAKRKWDKSRNQANAMLGKVSDRDLLMLICGIYWGEGSKNEFNLINGDPYLIKVFIKGLYSLGIKREEITLNFRFFSDMNREDVIDYWIKFLDMDIKQVSGCEIIQGNGSKRLLYGMCRVRVKKAAPHFKLMMSMIDLIRLSNKPS